MLFLIFFFFFLTALQHDCICSSLSLFFFFSSLSTAMHTCHKVAAIQAEPLILNCYLNDRLYALCHAQLVEIG